MPAPVLIQSAPALQRMLPVLARARQLAVDTESNSLHAYREQVCLLQFSADGADYLVDALAGLDLSPLGALFADPAIEKVFHAAEYDILCLKRDYGFTFAGLFDTMQAARILGFEKIGLADVLRDLFAIEHPKALQKADWGERPLSPEMIAYASTDTRHLAHLRTELGARLQQAGLLELAREDFARLCAVQPNHSAPAPHYAQVSGWQKLEPTELRTLEELCRYRDEMARRLDRPHFKVMASGLLITLAQNPPRTAQALLTAPGMTPRQFERFGPGLLGALARAKKLPPITPEKHPRPPQAYLDRLDALQNWRKQAGVEMKVQSDIILPRDVLERIAAHRPDGRESLAQQMADVPWRFSRFGDQILQVLAKGK
jgi:ribonuclease D